jgi:glycosyltransferase involved in cell wall biosynthesis
VRVAYFSPLSPIKSGIAKYSELLIPHLSKLVDIDIFVDGYTPTSRDIKRSCVYDYREFERHRVTRKYDALIYQMGNSPYHEYIYDTLIRRPGITVLHDYLLHHFVSYKTLARIKAGEYVEECGYCDGELSEALATGRVYGLYTPLQDFLFPTNRRVIERSLAVLVHSEYVKEQITQKFPKVTVEKISFAAPSFADAASLTKDRSRKELGMSQDELAISCFGFITPPKRIRLVLRVFSRLRGAFPQARCYLVGEPLRGYDVRSLVRDFDVEDAVKITGYVEEAVFDQYVAASDICVNLRYPSAGETSGTAIYCMAAGKPVVISNYAQFAEFPDSCCAKIDLGPNEQNQLFECLFKLASDESLRASMGANARMLIERECSPAKAADQYFGIIKKLIGGHAIGRWASDK